MKNYIKNHCKNLLFIGICLFSYKTFSASLQTKQMIQNVLSKYCIPNDKTLCNTPYEGKYDPSLSFCLCADGMVYNRAIRKCIEVPPGTFYQKNMKTNTPVKCNPGSYAGGGAYSCTLCSPGTYASGYGNIGCSSCSPGTYQSSSGQSGCISCPPNHTSSAGATSCVCTCQYGCNSNNSCKDYCDVYDCSPSDDDNSSDDNSDSGYDNSDSGDDNSSNSGGNHGGGNSGGGRVCEERCYDDDTGNNICDIECF